VRGTPEYLPITPSTVEILGHNYLPTDTIWAGLRLSDAYVREVSLIENDHHLAVPWCHINDPSHGADDAVYRVRSKDARYRFVKATNGAWVLRLAF